MTGIEKFKKIWDPIDKVVFTILKYVCALLLAALIMIVFYIFVGRYILHDSPMWGEPLSLFILTWMIDAEKAAEKVASLKDEEGSLACIVDLSQEWHRA